ncbi:neuropilin and tolloid 1 [Labeo rohita]|nr:neuropilin and tolloid 1 [Labeo rohita]
MIALQRQYGQPHQLAQSEIAALLNSPDIRVGDAKAFQSFALNVDLLVGMLLSLEGPQGRELSCTGHVDRLLSKLPKHYRDSFIEHLQLRGRLHTDSLNPYNLHDLADWLKVKAEAQRLSTKMVQRYQTERLQVSLEARREVQPYGCLHRTSSYINRANLPPQEAPAMLSPSQRDPPSILQ